MQAQDQLHVLADRFALVAADFDQRFLVKKSEGTGDDQQAVDRRPAHATEKKSSQVFDHLDEREKIRRQADFFEKVVTHRAAVGDAYRTADGDGSRIVDEGPHDAAQGVGLQHGVRIDDAHQRIAAGVDTRVRRIRLGAAVFLVDHPQVLVTGGTVDAPDRCAIDPGPVSLRKFPHAERVDQFLQRVVGRTVIDDDEFVLAVLELQQRLDRRDDRCRFVVRGNHDADRNIEGGEDRFRLRSLDAQHVPANGCRRDDVLRQIAEVDANEVREKEPLPRQHEITGGHASPTSAKAWSSISAA